MHILNKTYITQKFGLSNTHIIVILNGIHQPQLSCNTNSIVDANNTLIIKANSQNTQPYHLLFITTQDCDTTYEVVAENNSSATIIEEHISLTTHEYTQKIITKFQLAPHSTITHTKLQTNIPRCTKQHITTEISQAANSRFTSTFCKQGLQNHQEKFSVNLAGEYASYKLRGINMLTSQQMASDNIEIQHHKTHGTSDILIKNILDGNATSDFTCRVITEPNAIKTTTRVHNKNLLLTETAKAHTAPEMEIYTDDVNCTHGATVGQLDTEALFYLYSRGISHKLATQMLLGAFAQEIVDYLPDFPRFKVTNPSLDTA